MCVRSFRPELLAVAALALLACQNITEQSPPDADVTPGGSDGGMDAPADARDAASAFDGPGDDASEDAHPSDDVNEPAPEAGVMKTDAEVGDTAPMCSGSEWLCEGACRARTAPCQGQCYMAGERVCPAQVCRAPGPNACGPSCATCTAPANATAACRNDACTFDCVGTHKVCGNACIPQGSCCADSEDCVAPTVTSVSPQNGATGVTKDAEMRVTFSEAMDRASVTAAFSSSTIPTNAGSFSWNPASTVLTIVPSSTLAYATGLGPALDAKAYAFVISNAAKDRSGNGLAAPLNVTFYTLREPTQSCAIIPELTGSTNDYHVPSRNTSMYLYTAGFKERIHVSFDCSTLPSALQLITDASFRVTLTSGSWSQGQWIVTEPISFTQGALNGSGVYGAAPLAPGVQMDPSGIVTLGLKRVDVTTWVRDDWKERATRSGRSQFRLRFHVESEFNGNNAAIDSPDETSPPELVVRYLIP